MDGQGIERDGQLGERQELLQLAGEVQDLSSKRVEHRALSEGIPQERERASAHVVVASRERPVEAKEVTSSQPVGQHRSRAACGAHHRARAEDQPARLVDEDLRLNGLRAGAQTKAERRADERPDDLVPPSIGHRAEHRANGGL